MAIAAERRWKLGWGVFQIADFAIEGVVELPKLCHLIILNLIT